VLGFGFLSELHALPSARQMRLGRMKPERIRVANRVKHQPFE
jgi:hypothetical protein